MPQLLQLMEVGEGSHHGRFANKRLTVSSGNRLVSTEIRVLKGRNDCGACRLKSSTAWARAGSGSVTMNKSGGRKGPLDRLNNPNI